MHFIFDDDGDVSYKGNKSSFLMRFHRTSEVLMFYISQHLIRPDIFDGPEYFSEKLKFIASEGLLEEKMSSLSR